MQYKNIFFDLDDTLWAFSFNARDTFEEMYRKYEYDRYFGLLNISMNSMRSVISNCGQNMQMEK